MAARGYEFYLRVPLVSLTAERSERAGEIVTAREDKYPQAAMLCSFYFKATDEISR